jgi:hypothetical protein
MKGNKLAIEPESIAIVKYQIGEANKKAVCKI